MAASRTALSHRSSRCCHGSQVALRHARSTVMGSWLHRFLSVVPESLWIEVAASLGAGVLA